MRSSRFLLALAVLVATQAAALQCRTARTSITVGKGAIFSREHRWSKGPINCPRRELNTLALAACTIYGTPLPAVAARYVSEVASMSKKVKALRAIVRQGPATNDLCATVTEFKDKTLKKNLVVAMSSIAPGLALAEEAKQKKVEVLPLLVQGHIVELEQALTDKKGFGPYTSPTTKKVYPGGKVERELEEIDETVDEFLELASLSNAPYNNLKK